MARSGHACLKKPELCDVSDSRRARGNVQFREGSRDVAVNGVLADAQPLGNGLVAQTAGNQTQHFQVPGGQAAGVLRRDRGGG